MNDAAAGQEPVVDPDVDGEESGPVSRQLRQGQWTCLNDLLVRKQSPSQGVGQTYLSCRCEDISPMMKSMREEADVEGERAIT